MYKTVVMIAASAAASLWIAVSGAPAWLVIPAGVLIGLGVSLTGGPTRPQG